MSNNTKKYRVTAAAIFASAAAFSFPNLKNRQSVSYVILHPTALLPQHVGSWKDTLLFANNNNSPNTLQRDDCFDSIEKEDLYPTVLSSSSRTNQNNRLFVEDQANLPQQNARLSMARSASEEKQQFELHVGKAVDTLRHDYPKILITNPDFSIYDPNIEVVDPSGVKLHNLSNYKTSLQFLHAIINFFYCTDKSGLTFRVHYDGARRNIRVSWNAILVPRVIYGGIRNRLHVDGISVYELDYISGLITQHRIEHLLINDAPVQAPQGIFLAIAREAMSGPDGIPILSMDRHNGGHFLVEFQQNTHFFTNNSTSLFSGSESSPSKSHEPDLLQVHSMALNHPLFNQQGYDKKNASRKKFGLPPISPSEYIEIQAKVQEMDSQQRAKASSVASSPNAATDMKKRTENVLGKIFGNTFESTCQSNFDCERPEICCDFGFTKRCCRSGLPVFDGSPTQLQPKLIPVPASTGFPRGGPEGLMDDYGF